MEKILYDLMDWAGIEELVYSEASDPGRLLGEHVIKEGLLIQAFLPNAEKVSVKIGGELFPMEMADENGFFAVLLEDRKELVPYHFCITYTDGDSEEIVDPYSYQFHTAFTEEEVRKFGAGIYYDSYEKFGAHPAVEAGIEGVHFAVWAPDAMRVSVVGDFNFWDGRRHQMKKRGPSGIYEIFIPNLKPGAIYKYEIKTKAGLPMLKADPYGNYAELRPNTASVVWDMSGYKWNDDEWIKERAAAKDRLKDSPMSIYEVHLGSWMQKTVAQNENGEDINGSQFYNYREIAEKLAAYVKEMGYTHVELMGIAEHPFDGSWGYQVTGYYAPTSRYGTPDDFRYFVDLLHCAGIGVILDWVPAHFPKDDFGLARFDGTALYEHLDPRQGEHPEWGTYIYNYGRPQVRNFLIANALFWAKEYHVDGLRMDAVASMLYLDYGKKNGEWVANIYGGNENLEAVEFFKQLNAVYRKKNKTSMLIAEESTAWPMVTGDIKDGSLGFDYKWNMGWMNDFLDFMSADPLFRKGRYGELTFSMIYAYSEDFILVISHDEVVHGKCSMINKMPEDELDEKFSDLRAAYGFMYTHPGKKLLFMGQEFAQFREWSEKRSLDWFLLDEERNKQMQDFVRELNHLYAKYDALYVNDYDTMGFEWMSCENAQMSTVSFVRRGLNAKDQLLFICNFTPVEYDAYRTGVPCRGRYELLLSSDEERFGGTGVRNKKFVEAGKEECEGKTYSLQMKLPPLSVNIYRFDYKK